MALLSDGELAVTKGVPQLDAPVARAGNDLAVVGGERNGEDIVGVSDEPAGGGAGGQLPEAESLVPRGRESVSTIGGDHLFPVSAKPTLVSHDNHGYPIMPFNVRSRRRCGSDRGASAWGNRTGTRRG